MAAGPLPTDAALAALGDRWASAVRALWDALGWPAPDAVCRSTTGPGEVFLGLYALAPVDLLDAAVDAAERAWAAALAAASIDTLIADEPLAQLRAAAAGQRRPALGALLGAAEARGLVATWDDDAVSVGVGARGRTWPADALPAPDGVDWDVLGNAPVALVTGSNGKTTTTRLVARMLREAGHTVGRSSTDGVLVQAPEGPQRVLEEGDWAGPGGARLVLRDPAVTAAVLETARGGLSRRGLAVRRATAAAVTNISADHYGDYGVYTLDELAAAKLVVAQALVTTRGLLVVSADDATLAARAEQLAGEPYALCWVASDPHDAAAARLVDAHAAAGGQACRVRHGAYEWHDGAYWHAVVSVADVPLTAGGHARHNVANAATAIPLALALGAPLDAVRRALRTFGAQAGDNPGRLETVRVGDVTAVVDYAHNPAGMAALLDTSRGLPARRRLLVLGQAGDRDDAALADLARAAWQRARFDRVVVKELGDLLRGRAAGEVPAVLHRALVDAGASEDAVDHATSEGDAVRRALTWAEPGDLLVLPLHENRVALVHWLRDLDAAGWRAGSAVPDPPEGAAH